MEVVKIYAFADEAGQEFDTQIAAMKENHLDGLEIRSVDNISVDDITIEKAKEIRKRLDDEGLQIWSIGSPIGKIDIETDDFASHFDKFKRTLDIAEILGAECYRLFSFYVGQNYERHRNEVMERLGMFVEAAAGYKVTLCHENEKGIYGDTALRCLEILKALPQVKAVFDPANFIQCGQDTLEAWEILKPHVKYLHIKDALADGSVVPAGKGIGHVGFIARDYILRGGSAFTIEPHLTAFDGLSKLERGGGESKVGQCVYESDRASFDTACNEFKQLLTEIYKASEGRKV